MPKIYNTAAKSTREMASNRRKHLFTAGLVAIGVIVVFSLISSISSSIKIGGVGIFVLLLAIRIIGDLFDNYSNSETKKIRRAERGADAEEEVADSLDQLSNDFVVLHDIESPYGNIDHIVISQKSGIYLLETKSHWGTVTTTESEILVNGEMPEKDFAAQALKNSYWLREVSQRILNVKPWITPVVVFTNAFVKYGRPVKGVRVINRKFLLRMLQTGRSTSNAMTIWTNRERLVSYWTGQDQLPVIVDEAKDKFCPKCGKKFIEKTAKGGSQVEKRFLVCQDYPKCKTAIPME